jgi:Coenzyme PQQ synthesis protein D (PqqD)
MLDRVHSRYFALNPVGRRVWELIDAPQSVAALCAALRDEYDVPDETCRSDVLALLRQMVDAGLVEAR